MAAMAAEVQQTYQENNNKVNHDGKQNGGQNIKMLLNTQLSSSSKASGSWKWCNERII